LSNHSLAAAPLFPKRGMRSIAAMARLYLSVPFHSYPWLVHRLTYRRKGQHNITVRGYMEKGNIDTPLELAIRNGTDRYSLAMAAIDRMPRLGNKGAAAREWLLNEQIRAKEYAFSEGVDHIEVTEWRWPF